MLGGLWLSANSNACSLFLFIAASSSLERTLMSYAVYSISNPRAVVFESFVKKLSDNNVAAEDINLMFPAFVIASCCAVAGIAMIFILKVINKRKDARSS